MNRVLEKYLNEVKPELMKKFEYKSVMQAPKLDKIVINMGVGDAMANSKALDAAVEDLTQICVKNQSLQKQENQSLHLNYVKEQLSDVK